MIDEACTRRLMSTPVSIAIRSSMYTRSSVAMLPDAPGNIGTNAIAKAAPDGQTIGVSIAGPLAVNTLLYKQMPYDPARDLEPVTIAATQPAVLVVSPKLAVANASELFANLKKNSGKYSFPSTGAGTASHLGMEAISSRTGADRAPA